MYVLELGYYFCIGFYFRESSKYLFGICYRGEIFCVSGRLIRNWVLE